VVASVEASKVPHYCKFDVQGWQANFRCQSHRQGGDAMQQDVPRTPALSPHYAFVVQFSTETQVEAGRLVGRVEHVVSSQAVHFHSLEALLAFLARLLKQVQEEQQPEPTPQIRSNQP
jgi:hypothetical protein